jgi:VIT1/CCC1 family predicted Fe2+/Mn2+ transporter
MTPLHLIAWAGAVSASLLIIGLGIAIVVAIVEGVKK